MVWREKLDMCSKQCKKILILRFYRSFFPVKETTKRQLTEPWQHSEKAPLQLNDYSFMSSPTAWTQQIALWLCSFVNYQKAEELRKPGPGVFTTDSCRFRSSIQKEPACSWSARPYFPKANSSVCHLRWDGQEEDENDSLPMERDQMSTQTLRRESRVSL